MSDILYSTDLGKYYLGKCEETIQELNLKEKVQLILTSPPFPLNNKKQYGNLNGEEYLKWFTSLAELFSSVLTPNGSIVIEMGNAWEKNRPVQSLLHLNSLYACIDNVYRIGMLVVLDSILNRITQNRAKGRNTFIFIDEIYLLFQHEYSANFLFTLWKRVRKYGAYCTGITQNVDDLLQSHTARTMLANSEFIIMLNQASTDRIELAKLLNISDLQMSYITNVGAGQGLLKVGSSLVPFINKFPRNTELYKLMTTKFGEV